MKKLFLIILLFATSTLFAQNKIYKIGVFAPLYLDSVFSNTDYITDKSLPKFIMPAVDFVQGAEIAFDTLLLFDKERVETNIYDTRSIGQPIPVLIKNHMLDSLNLIIGSVKDQDFKQLAD